MREKLKNNEIAVTGDQWPLLLYADGKYDPEEPWDGLFRNKLLVWVCFQCLIYGIRFVEARDLQAFKHIFTSPSSVEIDAKATRSGNARIHGMTQVTTASLAYIATQVSLSFLTTNHSLTAIISFNLCYLLPPCSVVPTLQQTLSDFI